MGPTWTINDKGTLCAADGIRMDGDNTVWTLCGRKFYETSLELNLPTCASCLERLRAFGPASDDPRIDALEERIERLEQGLRGSVAAKLATTRFK